MTIGIIGGSGLSRLAGLELIERKTITTPFGMPSAALSVGRLNGVEVVFLARHGDEHTIAPHQINYRANIWAMKHLNAEVVVAVASVGGIRADLGPGSLVVPDQIIDYTHGRASTFFEGHGQPVTHIDFTHPYDSSVRALLMKAGKRAGEMLVDGGTYGCAQGPRLETAAEIRRMERDGCDLVGMTCMPEAALARELGIPYAMLSVVVNHAAGKGDSHQGIELDAIHAMLDASMQRVVKVLEAVLTE